MLLLSRCFSPTPFQFFLGVLQQFRPEVLKLWPTGQIWPLAPCHLACRAAHRSCGETCKPWLCMLDQVHKEAWGPDPGMRGWTELPWDPLVSIPAHGASQSHVGPNPTTQSPIQLVDCPCTIYLAHRAKQLSTTSLGHLTF